MSESNQPGEQIEPASPRARSDAPSLAGRTRAQPRAAPQPTRVDIAYPNPYPNQRRITPIFARVRQRACTPNHVEAQRDSEHRRTVANTLAISGGQVVERFKSCQPDTDLVYMSSLFSGEFQHLTR